MDLALWTTAGLLLGSLPFSFWTARLARGVDLRGLHDGNPGASNVFKECGYAWGFLALALDWAKGFLPVILAQIIGGLTGWALATVSMAPVLGHAYSPFLNFRGGKALATSFGIWTALTLVPGPFVLGLLLTIFVMVQANPGWSVVFSMLAFLLYLTIQGLTGPLLVVWLADFALLSWKYRVVLRERVAFRWALAGRDRGVDG